MCRPVFWNFGALFTPQGHPAREMQDSFYVAGDGGPALHRRSPAPAARAKAVARKHMAWWGHTRCAAEKGRATHVHGIHHGEALCLGPSK